MADGATLESQIEELLDQETFEPPKAFAENALVTDESVVESADSAEKAADIHPNSCRFAAERCGQSG